MVTTECAKGKREGEKLVNKQEQEIKRITQRLEGHVVKRLNSFLPIPVPLFEMKSQERLKDVISTASLSTSTLVLAGGPP